MTSKDAKDKRNVSLLPYKHEHIPPSYLPNLKKYKYSGADFSIMSRYVLQSYWNFVVSLVPMTVAPNMITFTGFIIGMSSWFILMYYYFFENAVYPAWSWYYAAFSFFFYQTLDAIDGKQARRTGTGSPLGELFDHGCDAFLTPFVMMNVALAVNSSPGIFFLYMFQSSFGLFTAILEQYSTGTLDLGYASGPTEGILLCCGILLLSGAKSTAVWDTSIVGPYEFVIPTSLTVPLTPKSITIHIETMRSVLLLFFMMSWFFTVSSNILHIIVRPTLHKSKVTPYLAALPMFVLGVMHIFLYCAYPDVQKAFPFTFETSFGILTAICVTRMTIARLCQMPYNPFSWSYALTFIVTAVALVVHALEPIPSLPREVVAKWLGYSMVGLCALCIWQYIHMIITVFRQIANYLNINIMSITPKKQE